MASQPGTEAQNPPSDPEKPKARSSGEKRFRIELGCGSAAREALDRWRLFVDNWECSSPVELLHQALDSLLAQNRCVERDPSRMCHAPIMKPLTMDTSSQYRLLDTIATPTCLPKPIQAKPPSPTAVSVPLGKPSLHLTNGQQQGGGVRKRQRRKKLVGVGTISENTKRILLEHIPERGTEKKSIPKSEAEQDRVPPIPPSEATPPTTSLPLSSIHSSTSSSSSSPYMPSSLSSLSSTVSPSPAYPQPVHSEPASIRLNFPTALSLQAGLLSLPRPIFPRLRPEFDTKPIPALIPVTSIPCENMDRVATVKTTPTSTSVEQDKLVSNPGGEFILSDDGGDQAEGYKETNQGEEEGEGGTAGEGGAAGNTVTQRRRGRLPGKNRRTRPVMPRKKKTKGLGGSISETTRRILLEHTSSDKTSETKKLSEATRRILIEHTSGDKTRSDVLSDPSGPQTILISPSSDGRSLESTSGHQSVTFPGTISESTKRILLEYYS